MMVYKLLAFLNNNNQFFLVQKIKIHILSYSEYINI